MIAPMVKITFVGLGSDKERFLQQLQEIGVAHLIFPRESEEPMDLVKALGRVTETCKFLAAYAGRAAAQSPLSSREICEKREILSQRETRLQAEISALKKDGSVIEAWGDFQVQQLQLLQRKGLHIQFFRVPPKHYASLPLGDVYHQVIAESRGEICFITVSSQPLSLPVQAEKLPCASLSEIRTQLAEKHAQLEQIAGEYAALAAHLPVLKREEAALTNLQEHRRAMLNANNELEGRLFAVKCWSPLPERELAAKIPASFPIYHFSEPPAGDESVPVLLRNNPIFDSGEDLVKVYSHPSYTDFDPSGFVLYCFAMFFGMIIGDTGYGLALLALTVVLRWKFKRHGPFVVRFFRLMYFLSIAVTVYGIISGGYFGIMLDPQNPLSKLCIIDLNTKAGQNQAMIIAVIIGMLHISLSFLVRFKNTREPAALGWVGAIWSGYFLINSRMAHGVDNLTAQIILIVSLAVVFVFSSRSKNIAVRILGGLNGLLGIVQVFSDVLSYLRLFALGIATIYMAHTFNMLAREMIAALPWIGYLFAAIILVAGHSVNLLLGIMGGVIHGLRLNFLEWYRWCFTGDGVAYRPFARIKY